MADHSYLHTLGGQNGAAIVAVSGTSGATTVISSAQGRLCRVVITAAGTGAALPFYDSNTTGVGNVVFSTAATTQTVGTAFDVQMPCATGIVAVSTTGTPGVAIGYNLNTVYGF